MPGLAHWVQAALLVSLRIAPVMTFAQPFSLIRLPARFRLLLALSLSGALAGWARPMPDALRSNAGALLVAAASELALGLLIVLVFELTFAALAMVGRTIDIQSGLGIAVLVDPSTRAQAPLVGTLFAYATGALFFAANGHLELLHILAASLDAVPVGAWQMPGSIAHLAAFASAIFVAGFEAGALVIVTLFALDLAVAVMSRTVPQMNALVIGFQVKTLTLLLLLPMLFGLGGALMARLMRMMLEALPELIG